MPEARLQRTREYYEEWNAHGKRVNAEYDAHFAATLVCSRFIPGLYAAAIDEQLCAECGALRRQHPS